MRLSQDKISHLAHLLKSTVIDKQLATVTEPFELVKVAKHVLTHYCQLDEQVDALARKKLQSYSRNIMEGSREWDVLYRKHFDEEMKKKF